MHYCSSMRMAPDMSPCAASTPPNDTTNLYDALWNHPQASAMNLYMAIAGEYEPADLLVSGSVNSLLGMVMETWLPLRFSGTPTNVRMLLLLSFVIFPALR